MASKNQKAPAKTASLEFKFEDGRHHRLSLEDVAFQYLRQYALMFAADDPALKTRAITGFREIAGVIARTETGRLWMARQNREIAAKDRPSRRHPDADEIQSEFLRLIRENHTERQARGLLRSWGRWSDSAVTRYAKKTVQ